MRPRHLPIRVLALGLVAALCCVAARPDPHTARNPALLSAGVTGVPGAARLTLGPAVTAFDDKPTDVAAQQAWLAAARLPGRTDAERRVAARALLDLGLLTAPNGATVAAPFGPWDLVWPRDASWVAAALSVCGRGDTALSVLRFLARTQSDTGAWAVARYYPSGDPVPGRAAQLDAVGWVPWAVWLWWRSAGSAADLDTLWPMVRAAADAAADSLRPDGLPRASADYWELPERRPTLGTAAPLLLGLRAAADLAAGRENDAAARWAGAAKRLDAAIVAHFGATGYRRYPHRGAGPDSAVALLAAPLAGPSVDSRLPLAIARAERALLMPSGGLRPGNVPRVGGVAWTPATALFALAEATGPGFDRWYGWLVAHRTELGEFPEKVTDGGQPASVAPLAWTDAIVLLALTARDGALPTPPTLGP
jgi:GH15 family glucan-1,4-alpha-glucosidase